MCVRLHRPANINLQNQNMDATAMFPKGWRGCGSLKRDFQGGAVIHTALVTTNQFHTKAKGKNHLWFVEEHSPFSTDRQKQDKTYDRR